MSDVTMIRGYGFPRGSRMDYAGYGSYGAPQDVSLFNKVPQLDGYGYANVPRVVYQPLGDPMVLPTLDLTDVGKPVSGLALAAAAIAVWALFIRK